MIIYFITIFARSFLSNLSDVRQILSTICKHDFHEKSGQVDVLITVLKMLDQQNCEHKKENKALVERLKKLELEKSRQRTGIFIYLRKNCFFFAL